MYYDRQGNPISREEWMHRFDNPRYKRIEKTEVMVDGKEILVSTVWLGMDHGFGGPPLIFETMIVGLPGNEQPTWRYHTEKEALEGHKRAVQCLRDPLGRFTMGVVVD